MPYIKSYRDLKTKVQEEKLDFTNLVQGFKQFNKQDFWNLLMVIVLVSTVLIGIMTHYAQKTDKNFKPITRPAILYPTIGEGTSLKLQGN